LYIFSSLSLLPSVVNSCLRSSEDRTLKDLSLNMKREPIFPCLAEDSWEIGRGGRGTQSRDGDDSESEEEDGDDDASENDPERAEGDSISIDAPTNRHIRE